MTQVAGTPPPAAARILMGLLAAVYAGGRRKSMGGINGLHPHSPTALGGSSVNAERQRVK